MYHLLDGLFQVDVIVTILAAGGTLATVLIFALPYLKKDEARKRTDRVVDYRKHLLEEERKRIAERREAKVQQGQGPNAQESVTALFKSKKYGQQKGLRERLSAAGLRKPSHLVGFMTIQVISPFALAGITLFLILIMPKPVPMQATVAFCFLSAVFGYFLPSLMLKNMALKREEAITLAFPDALDLMLVCVEGGLGIEQAINTITAEFIKSSPVIAEEFGILSAELSFLGDRQTALRNFAGRLNTQQARSFANALVQSEKYGTPLARALRTLSYELRDQRFALAEKKAAALPPKLTVPMIAFFMPTLFIVILGPAVIQAMDTIRNV